jgi:predicted nucleic acid-binding Zn ribbon protein
MPTYEFQCDAEHEVIEQFYNINDVPRILPCPHKMCKMPAKRLIGCGAAAIFKGDWPGKTLTRTEENQTLTEKAQIARRMKRSGKVPMDAVIHAKDVDRATYSGPKHLPTGHPENIKPSEVPAPPKPKKRKAKRKS